MSLFDVFGGGAKGASEGYAAQREAAKHAMEMAKLHRKDVADEIEYHRKLRNPAGVTEVGKREGVDVSGILATVRQELEDKDLERTMARENTWADQVKLSQGLLKTARPQDLPDVTRQQEQRLREVRGRLGLGSWNQVTPEQMERAERIAAGAEPLMTEEEKDRILEDARMRRRAGAPPLPSGRSVYEEKMAPILTQPEAQDKQWQLKAQPDGFLWAIDMNDPTAPPVRTKMKSTPETENAVVREGEKNGRRVLLWFDPVTRKQIGISDLGPYHPPTAISYEGGVGKGTFVPREPGQQVITRDHWMLTKPPGEMTPKQRADTLNALEKDLKGVEGLMLQQGLGPVDAEIYQAKMRRYNMLKNWTPGKGTPSPGLGASPPPASEAGIMDRMAP